MLNRLNSKTGFIVTFLGLCISFLLNYTNVYDIHQLCQKVQKTLNNHEKAALSKLNLMREMLKENTPEQLFDLFEGSITELYTKENIALYAFKNDTLKFWTSNQIPLDLSGKDFSQENGMIHLRNGWYEYFFKNAGEIKTVALILIKPEYDVQNNYLNNSFAAWLDLPASVNKIKFPVVNSDHALRSINNKDLFEIDSKDVFAKSKTKSNWSVFLFFVSFAMILFLVLKNSLNKSISIKQFILGSILLFGVRTLMIYFKWPGLLYNIPIYEATTYGNADSFFNGLLGDILLNSVLLFVWAFVFYKQVQFRFTNKTLQLFAPVLLMFLIIFLSFELNVIIKSLIENSTISFDFLNFFNLKGLSFLCLGIVFFYGFSIAVILEKWLAVFFEAERKQRNLILVFCILVYAATYFIFLKHHFGKLETLWFLSLFLFSYLLKRFSFNRGVVGLGFRILLFSIITSCLFIKYNLRNETKNIIAFSDKLSDRMDPFLEDEFSKLTKKLKNDTALNEQIKHLPESADELEQRIRQQYFKGYFEKYNLQLMIFDSLCLPDFKNSNLILNNNDFFEEQIKTAVPTISEDLFFIEEYKPNARYIGKISFNKKENEKPSHVLFAMLEPKRSAEAGSFLELLLDKQQQKQNKYPYAIYKQNKLSDNYGDFDYPLNFVSLQKLESINPAYEHRLVPNADAKTQIIVSNRKKDFTYYFTTNSYYFLFYSVLGLIMVFGYYVVSDKVILFFSLNRRIQFFIVSILFFALSAVGIFSVRLVIKKSEEDRTKQLTESAQRINEALSPLLFNTQKLEANNKDYAEAVLKKYAVLFNSEISLYDDKGYLFASSRPQLFDLGLSSQFTNPLAIANFKRNQSTYFSTRDNIGSLNYSSLYNALYNNEGNFLGYINLPYFARQIDVEKELSDYITTLLNVYVVLFLVSLFTGLIVTAYITKPLRTVQQQLAKISLNKKNEPIVWESNDEIGGLVNEYNEMLLKLEESANLLARSEREGAWREMAKQVAHEIKNPLTPMKLNLQYMQKIVNEDGEDFKEKFKKISSSIIEQIDTLAHIANEFSNFAKMPKVSLQPVNIVEVIQSSIQLFKNEGSTKINLEKFSDSVLVVADKEQCLRVFNNLIKNSIQAIPENRNGLIEIKLEEERDSILVSVKDNGSGIAADMHEKIFVPNFTTKTTGTGLGLAMVKNIISSFEGKIWFESIENQGTTFFLRFRKS